MRNKYRDNKRRDLVNDLHFWHRTTYMGERYTYYERQEASERYPGTFMSDISDGMAGDKTKVPSLSDAYEFNPPLSLHVRFSESTHIIFIVFPLHYCFIAIV